METQIQQIKTSWPAAWALLQGLFWLLVALAVVLTALANLDLPADLARANPRLASALVFARKVAPVLRGALKPLLGIFAPKIAAQVVSELFEAAPTSVPPTSEKKP